MKGKMPSVSEKEAAAVLQYHFGHKPRHIEVAVGGLVNYVFQAAVGKEEFVVRISSQAAKLQVFMKEQWAIDRARQNGVPTAEVLQVGNDVIGFPYMISRKVPGLPCTDCRDNESLLNELGKYAAIINSIPTRDFGPIFDWSPNKLSRRRTWREYLDEELRVEARCKLFLRTGVLNRAEIRELRAQLNRMRKWNARPTLSHGDIRLKNVVVDEKGRIAAILDWEKTTSNLAPYWELSIALHDLTIDEKEMFLRGYGLSPKDYLKVAPGIKALNLLNYAKAARLGKAAGQARELHTLRMRLSGALDLYSL